MDRQTFSTVIPIETIRHGPLELHVAGLSDQGEKITNEDRICYTHSSFALFDGMSTSDGTSVHIEGGAVAADIASAIYLSSAAALASHHILQYRYTIPEILEKMHEAVDQVRAERGLRKIITTAACLRFSPINAEFGWAGDSRLYKKDASGFRCLTPDHTQGKYIIHGIGHPSFYNWSLENQCSGTTPFEPGDVFLLCSDGLYHRNQDSLEKACKSGARKNELRLLEKLYQEAHRISNDNISGIFIRVAYRK